MRCPKCHHGAIKTIKSIKKEYRRINKRVLLCLNHECNYLFSTTENIDENNIAKKTLQNDSEQYRLFQQQLKNKSHKKK